MAAVADGLAGRCGAAGGHGPQVRTECGDFGSAGAVAQELWSCGAVPRMIPERSFSMSRSQSPAVIDRATAQRPARGRREDAAGPRPWAASPASFPKRIQRKTRSTLYALNTVRLALMTNALSKNFTKSPHSFAAHLEECGMR